MKKIWKWIIGIVIVLVVAALVVGGVFLLRSHFGGITRVVQMNRPGVQVPWNGKTPFNGNDNGQRGGPGNMPGFRQFGGGGYAYPMRGHGMMGFGMFPFAGIFGGLVCLGFLALVILGIVWLVRGRNKSALVAAPVAAVAPANPVASEVAPTAPMVSTHACKKCGEPVQDNWKVCPYCGKKQ